MDLSKEELHNKSRFFFVDEFSEYGWASKLFFFCFRFKNQVWNNKDKGNTNDTDTFRDILEAEGSNP